MSVVPTTLIAVAALLMLLWLGPRRGLWAFLFVTPFGAAAAINLPAVGNASILLADFVAAMLFGLILLGRGNLRVMLALAAPPKPGFFLICVLAISLIVTLFGPRIFKGIVDVYSLARDDTVAIELSKLKPNTANITQMLRLTLSSLTFFSMATVFRRQPDTGAILRALAVATSVNVILGAVDWISFTAGFPQILEPIRTANYAMAFDQVMAGMKRMVGGFPEPSSFGYYTIGLFGFWFQYWVSGGRSKLAVPMLLAVTFVLFMSASSSAYAGTLVFLCFCTLLNATRQFSRNVNPRTVYALSIATIFLPVVASLVVMAYQLNPDISAYFDRVLFDKMDSQSAEERGRWNMQAVQTTFDTFGFGAGLGSVRASNFLIAVFSSIGVLGAIFYALFLISFATAKLNQLTGERLVVVRALRAGCLALFLRALITKPSPDLEIIFFALAGLAIGLLPSAREQQQAGYRSRPREQIAA